MKQITKKFVMFCFFVIILLLGSPHVMAGELNLENLDFEVKLNYDGSMDVIEKWDIRIQDTNTLYKSFEKDNGKYSGITDVTVREITEQGTTAFTQVSEWQYHVTKDCYYGTFNEDGNFEIGWGVGLDSGSDRRQYIIEYTVKDAIKKANDCAELYWQFIGSDFEIPTEKITGRVYLPDDVDNIEDIKVWGHTEFLNGLINATSKNEVQFSGTDLPSNTFFEVRVLFPTDLVYYSARTENTNILQSVVEEETKWANAANEKRQNMKFIFLIVSIIADAIFIIAILNHYEKLRKMPAKYEPQEKMDFFRDIPNESRTPGEAYRILNKVVSEYFSGSNIGNIFSANLLNLNVKQNIDIIPDPNDKKEFTIELKKECDRENTKEEKAVYDFLQKAVGGGDKVTLKSLKKYISKYPGRVEKLLKDVSKAVEKTLRDEKLIDTKNRDKIGETTLLATLLLIFLGIGYMIGISIISEYIQFTSLFGWMIFITIALIILDVILLITLNNKVNIFSQEAVNEAEKWKALKKFMEEFSMMDKREVPEVVLWEKYLVFATAFGIADKVIKQLKMVYPNIENELSINTNVNMYLAMNSDFSSSFSKLVNSAMTSTLSSGSGSGGGFSGRRRRWPEAGGGGGGR